MLLGVADARLERPRFARSRNGGFRLPAGSARGGLRAERRGRQGGEAQCEEGQEPSAAGTPAIAAERPGMRCAGCGAGVWE